ncbi:MAG: hydrogen peroxide-dependent heme synthase [Nitrospinota bacterium]
MNQDNHQAVVPEVLDGWAVLHHVFSVDWPRWNALSAGERAEMAAGAAAYFEEAAGAKEGESAIFSLLGHKGDLLFLNFRKTLDELNAVELGFRRLALYSYLTETTSYLSFLELGLYEMTIKLHGDLIGEGLEPEGEEWKIRWADEMDGQRDRMSGRLFMEIPEFRYLCFYPMSKRRGEEKNWYGLPIKERQMMMREHGMVGRKYAGRVQQIITGSIGLDDWEWGVYLFAPNPRVFKELIYEMRFDEATVWYGEFGPFYNGLRIQPGQLAGVLNGGAREADA